MKGFKPLVIKLEGSGRYRRILGGPPQTSGMRSGYVNLRPGESVGEHSTESREEAIVILNGKAQIDFGRDCRFSASADSIVYVPVHTAHNVKNTGSGILRYLYIVSPAANPDED